jgi:hypothetical protein
VGAMLPPAVSIGGHGFELIETASSALCFGG